MSRSPPSTNPESRSAEWRARELASLARVLGLPISELRYGQPPDASPWESPLDRTTYPRSWVALTATYQQWLGASVADLGRHYGNAYLAASASGSGDAERFKAAARVLGATATALLRRDDATLRKIAASVGRAGENAAHVPTRLYARVRRGTVSCESPFIINGAYPERSRTELATTFEKYLQALIRRNACQLDARRRNVAGLAAAMASDLAQVAPAHALIGRVLDDAAKRKLEKRFEALLRELRYVRWTAKTRPRALERAARANELEFARLARTLMRSVLLDCGYTKEAARNVLDHYRKREERADVRSIMKGTTT